MLPRISWDAVECCACDLRRRPPRLPIFAAADPTPACLFDTPRILCTDSCRLLASCRLRASYIRSFRSRYRSFHVTRSSALIDERESLSVEKRSPRISTWPTTILLRGAAQGALSLFCCFSRLVAFCDVRVAATHAQHAQFGDATNSIQFRHRYRPLHSAHAHVWDTGGVPTRLAQPPSRIHEHLCESDRQSLIEPHPRCRWPGSQVPLDREPCTPFRRIAAHTRTPCTLCESR